MPCTKWDCECAFKRQRGCCCAFHELQEAEDQMFMRMIDLSKRTWQLGDRILEVLGTVEHRHSYGYRCCWWFVLMIFDDCIHWMDGSYWSRGCWQNIITCTCSRFVWALLKTTWQGNVLSRWPVCRGISPHCSWHWLESCIGCPLLRVSVPLLSLYTLLSCPIKAKCKKKLTKKKDNAAISKNVVKTISVLVKAVAAVSGITSFCVWVLICVWHKFSVVW